MDGREEGGEREREREFDEVPEKRDYMVLKYLPTKYLLINGKKKKGGGRRWVTFQLRSLENTILIS